MIAQKIEILAPAGNMDSLKAAVNNGADAVYLGLTSFSARAKASNFTLPQFSDAVRYAHLFGVKVYVALNTLLKDNEIEEALTLISEAKKMKADAFIIQDLGLLQEIKRTMPDIVLHASTQMGIHNVYGAIAAKKLGFKRIILSREATLDDIKQIKDNVDIEIENFVQGALCVAFSGNCLLSSLVSGYSGNRGKCLQLCRKKYDIEIDGIKDSGYYLSAKDICLLPHIQELIDAGVCSFKIEGRMRRPEYVGESVSVYKKALTDLPAFNEKKETERLKKIYNRGDYCSAYLKDPTNNVVYHQMQGHIGLKIGYVERVSGKIADLKTDLKINSGDGLKFVRDGKEVGSSLVSDSKRISFSGSVHRGDEVNITTDAKQLKKVNSTVLQKELSVTVDLRKYHLPCAEVVMDGVSLTKTGENIIEPAKTSPLSKESVVEIFRQTSAPYLKIADISVNMDSDIFIPVKQLKDLRRQCYSQIVENAVNVYNNDYYSDKSSVLSDIIPNSNSFDIKSFAQFDDFEVFPSLNESELIDGLIFSPKDYSDTTLIEKIFSVSKKHIFLNTPIMARSKDLQILMQLSRSKFIDNVVANNLYALELFKNKNIILGPMMNVLNSVVKCNKIAPYESEKISGNYYSVAFSKVPLMTFAHCPYKNLQKSCKKFCNGFSGKLIDERSNVFHLHHFKVANCYAQLFNDKPICIIDELKEKNHRLVLFDFCHCSMQEISDVLCCAQGNAPTSFPHVHFNLNKKLQ